MTAEATYVQVLLPLKLQWIPTYSTPTQLEPGRRVLVALGHRTYDGVVWRCQDQPDLPPERIQGILAVQDGLPDVMAEELRFWEFLSDYYLCTPGEVYKAAYPLLKLRSERTAADILGRLHTRLEKKEQQLAGRHSERVAARLAAERDRLLTQIAACTRARMTQSMAPLSFRTSSTSVTPISLHTFVTVALICSPTEPTILAFVARRSSRLMPGLRGIPAVTTMTSLLTVSA